MPLSSWTMRGELKNPSFSTRINLVDPLKIILEKIIKDLSCVFSTQVH
jgi:hypothetical protein